jgi:mRNA deadenylase 3'-5' endonuclease subunit Ccr4
MFQKLMRMISRKWHSEKHLRKQTHNPQAMERPQVVVAEPVTVATFNVLAPCYNPKEGGRHAATKLINSRQWTERHRQKIIKGALAHLAADVVCIQEYWFAPAFLCLYECEMANLGYERSSQKYLFSQFSELK